MFISTTENNPWQNGTKADSGKAIHISAEKPCQQVYGFGGCFNELGYKALLTISAKERAKVFDELFSPDNCNFSYNRMPIGANDFSESFYSLNEHEGDYEMKHFSIERDEKYIIPFIREAVSRQSENHMLFASPWTPPTWMKFPQAYNYGTLIKTPQNLKAYALYFKKFILAYKEKGITVNQIHVQNEPMSTQKFPSCKWTGEEFRNFIANYLYPELHDCAEIWLGTINGPETGELELTTRYNNYANYVLQDETCKKAVKGVSYQWAGKFAVGQTHEDYPELSLIQSESECGNGENSFAYAQYIFELMHHYFKNGVNGYIYWNIALLPGGESTWGWHQNSLITAKDGHAVFNPEFYLMKHFSHFVKRGARYCSVTGEWASNTCCFINPNGEKVFVLMNPFDEKKLIEIDGSILSLPPHSFNTALL